MTRFYPEDNCDSFKGPPPLCTHWVSSSPPLTINITNISKELKSLTIHKETNINTDKPIEENPFNIIDNNITTNQITLQESENIQPIRKPNLFAEEITELEQDIIEKRVALQQQQFAEFEKREFHRKAKFIHFKLWFVTDEEIKEALKDCKGDEALALNKMYNNEYFKELRKRIAHKHNKDAIDHDHRGFRELLKLQGPQKTSITELQAGSQKSIQKDDDDDKETTPKRPQRTASKRTRNSNSNFNNNRMKGRLALDDALKQIEDYDVNRDKAFEGWSLARKKAYLAIKTNPNTYYYRFNAPGEEQRLGAWTEEEEQKFFNRLEEVGSEGQWGIFSMKIPGRVDPNYVIDNNGKAHYLFSTMNKQTGETQKTIRTHSKHGSGGNECKTVRGGHSGAQDSPNSKHEKTFATFRPRSSHRKRSRKNTFNSDEEEEEDYDNDDSGSYVLKSWNSKKRARSYQESVRIDFEVVEQDDENPLPGFIDPITLEEVNRPAISPYGHVMGPNKNICPLTKKPLKRRELVILTNDNINQYRLVSNYL
nr:1217_t:CDS:10 [Entrophospora candida]